MDDYKVFGLIQVKGKTSCVSTYIWIETWNNEERKGGDGRVSRTEGEAERDVINGVGYLRERVTRQDLEG